MEILLESILVPCKALWVKNLFFILKMDKMQMLFEGEPIYLQTLSVQNNLGLRFINQLTYINWKKIVYIKTISFYNISSCNIISDCETYP